MDKKIGFIGCGNMGKAMLGGIISSNIADCKDIFVSARTENKLLDIKAQYGVNISTDNSVVAKNSDILIIAVKPQFLNEVAIEIKNDIKDSAIIVSVAAGFNIQKLENAFSKHKIIRVMPNTPALCLEAMSAICPNNLVKKDELEIVTKLFESFGKAEIVSENLFDAVIGVSSSSPAYVFMFIEALADGAVCEGMPRDKAYKFAAQAVLGSAKMVLETSMHPGALKDMVCSPGGTTIEAVEALEETGFRNSVIKAVRKCCEKSRQMSK